MKDPSLGTIGLCGAISHEVLSPSPFGEPGGGIFQGASLRSLSLPAPSEELLSLIRMKCVVSLPAPAP